MNNTYLLALLIGAPHPGLGNDPIVRRLVELGNELGRACDASDWGAVDRIHAEVMAITGDSR